MSEQGRDVTYRDIVSGRAAQRSNPVQCLYCEQPRAAMGTGYLGNGQYVPEWQLRMCNDCGRRLGYLLQD